MRVAAQSVGFVTHDQHQLAVRLQPDHAIDDVDAVLLQLACPGDVGLLIETGLDLDEREDLLAGHRSFDEGIDDGRIAAGAVEGLLDRQYPRIGGGLLDQPLNAGRERVIGVLDEHVLLAQRLEDIGRLAGFDTHQQIGMSLGQEAGVAEVFAVDARQREQPGQVEWRGDLEDFPLGDVQLAGQQLEHLVVDGLFDLQAHR